MKINIYCDESTHLENDKYPYLVIGAIKCNYYKRKEILEDIRKIKTKHNINSSLEFKWNKVSNNKIAFYKDLIIYFFSSPSLSFRAVIVPKSNLNNILYNQTYDDFYYKVYYALLKRALIPTCDNYVYIDIKDTKSSLKVKKLHNILSNSIYDFNYEYIKRIQIINSKESELIQLADLLIGAINYYNRGLHLQKDRSLSKAIIVDQIIKLSKTKLNQTSYLSSDKFNLFFMEI